MLTLEQKNNNEIKFMELLAKLNIGQNTPLDISFMLAYLVIALVRMFLPVI